MCSCKQHGGARMSPAQAKKLMGPVRKFSTLPVRSSQRNAQHGGDFLGIGRAFKKTFSNPLRGIAAVGTFGLSEATIRGMDLAEKVTGQKPSTILKTIGVPLSIASGGESALPIAATVAGLKMIGKGKPRRGRPKKRAPAKKRKRRK